MNIATRERRIEFIKSFGGSALEDAMCEMLVQCGPDWLTDEQIEDMTRDRIMNARRSQHWNIRNRKIWTERAFAKAGAAS